MPCVAGTTQRASLSSTESSPRTLPINCPQGFRWAAVTLSSLPNLRKVTGERSANRSGSITIPSGLNALLNGLDAAIVQLGSFL